MAKTAGRWGLKADFTNVRPKVFGHTHIFHKSCMFLLSKIHGCHLCSTFGWGCPPETPICMQHYITHVIYHQLKFSEIER